MADSVIWFKRSSVCIFIPPVESFSQAELESQLNMKTELIAYGIRRTVALLLRKIKEILGEGKSTEALSVDVTSKTAEDAAVDEENCDKNRSTV